MEPSLPKKHRRSSPNDSDILDRWQKYIRDPEHSSPKAGERRIGRMLLGLRSHGYISEFFLQMARAYIFQGMPCKLEQIMQTKIVGSAKVTDLKTIKLDTDRIPDPMWIVVNERFRGTSKAHESIAEADPTAEPMWIVRKEPVRRRPTRQVKCCFDCGLPGHLRGDPRCKYTLYHWEQPGSV